MGEERAIRDRARAFALNAAERLGATCFPEGHDGLQMPCYTPEEFERKQGAIGVVSEVIKTGTNVLEATE